MGGVDEVAGVQVSLNALAFDRGCLQCPGQGKAIWRLSREEKGERRGGRAKRT